MKLKRIFRFDPRMKIFRLFRVTRTIGRVGDGKGYSTKTTLAASPRLFNFWRDYEGWCLTVLGIRIHHARSYGGIFAAMLIAVALAINTGGCTSTDPTTGKQVIDIPRTQQTVDLLAVVAEDYAVLLMPKKADSDKWVAAIEKARQINDLPSLKLLLAQLQTGNTSLPLTPVK